MHVIEKIYGNCHAGSAVYLTEADIERTLFLALFHEHLFQSQY